MRPSLLSLSTAGYSAYLTEASGFKWDTNTDFREWMPPSQTIIVDPVKPGGEPIIPTSPPELKKAKLTKRSSQNDPQVCGYIDGSVDKAFTCDTSLTECYSNTQYKAFGCCSGSGCSSTADLPVQTTCLGSSEAAGITTSINDQTRLCTQSLNPYCMTMQYQDQVGYSAFTCTDEPSMTVPIYYNIASATSTSSTTSTTTSTPGQTSTNSNNSVPKDSVGAIVGGVIGCLAIISISLFVLCFFRRKKRNNAIQDLNAFRNSSTSDSYPIEVDDPPSMKQQYRLPSFHPDSFNVQKSPYNMTIESVYDPNFLMDLQGLSSPSHSFPPNSPLDSSQQPHTTDKVETQPDEPLSPNICALGISQQDTSSQDTHQEQDDQVSSSNENENDDEDEESTEPTEQTEQTEHTGPISLK